jgi:hypothetical protein
MRIEAEIAFETLVKICLTERHHSQKTIFFIQACSLLLLLYLNLVSMRENQVGPILDSFLAHFRYFEKWNQTYALSMPSLYQPYQLLDARTNFYETWYVPRGTWVHLNGVLHKSLPTVCVYVRPLIVARQRFGKKRYGGNEYAQQYKNCWTRRFLYGPCGIKRK